MRNFVLVTATHSVQHGVTRSGAGLKKLKRGTSLPEFVQEYLRGLNVQAEVLERGGIYTAIQRTPTAVFTWTFTVFPEDEIITAVRHMTTDELKRDLKELLPLKAAT